MRVATWNLERGGRSRAARVAQEETLEALRADVVVLTEPGPSYCTGPGVVASPALRSGLHGRESWVAIVGPTVEAVPVDIHYERMAVAARVVVEGRSLIVYGSVLPWLSVRSQAPELVQEGEAFADVFERVLEAQKADLVKLGMNGEVVLWAGDFNQSVGGPKQGGSRKGRDSLIMCLTGLGLMAWNGDAEHAAGGMRAVDLICGPKELVVRSQGRIDPVRDRLKMSDHAGYWVDL